MLVLCIARISGSRLGGPVRCHAMQPSGHIASSGKLRRCGRKPCTPFAFQGLGGAAHSPRSARGWASVDLRKFAMRCPVSEVETIGAESPDRRHSFSSPCAPPHPVCSGSEEHDGRLGCGPCSGFWVPTHEDPGRSVGERVRVAGRRSRSVSEPEREEGRPQRCSICGGSDDRSDEFWSNYRGLVCLACDARAVDEAGDPAWSDDEYDTGSNPVFIDGVRCRRRYRFGGWVTMREGEAVS